MTRFVVDCGVVLHLVGEGIEVAAEHEMLAPTLLRPRRCRPCMRPWTGAKSRRMSPSTGSPASGRCRSGSSATPCSGVEPGTSPTSWGWAGTYDAEYVALTQLQADAFVTLDADLARRVEGTFPTAAIQALQTT